MGVRGVAVRLRLREEGTTSSISVGSWESSGDSSFLAELWANRERDERVFRVRVGEKGAELMILEVSWEILEVRIMIDTSSMVFGRSEAAPWGLLGLGAAWGIFNP